MQVYDGVNTVTSPSRGFELPPINRIGMMLLQRYGQDGYVVSAPADAKKFSFRITSSDGYFTDFEVDSKTKLIKGYSSVYSVSGREVSTLVEVKKFVDEQGILIPSKFDQKFELGGMIVYASFNTKSIEVNGVVDAAQFALGNE
jgi:hypothetical protein